MSNVKLSAAELALACDAGLLLTKNVVIEKVYTIFGDLASRYQQAVQLHGLPPEALRVSPKISRGENYLGLPWVMLDYPRHFSGPDAFSIRTMFWWGRHFSQFILLQGKYVPMYIAEKLFATPSNTGWFLSVADDAWQHHFEPSHMLPLKDLPATQIRQTVENSGFLKIGRLKPIEDWDEIAGFMLAGFNEGLEMLGY